VATAAVAVPTLIAFNVAPSATFFNQAAAFVGWGGFLMVLATLVPRSAWPRAPGALALIGALTITAIDALAASIFGVMPWSLSLSSAGMIVAAVLVVAIAASTQRAGLAEPAFRAFCIGLTVAGIASALIGCIQVFVPRLPDGDWIAIAAVAGRATGNLRQPNHLSSLLLWSVVGAVWLGEAKALDRRIALALAAAFIYVVVLSASRTGALGMLTLAAWGLLDRRLSRPTRIALVLAPLLYAAMWWATSLWAAGSHQVFAGQERFTTSPGDISSSRFAIWSNALALIASHPWLGVGFGDFNFAWTLTPFPGRPTEFFDHTHNLVLNFAVEMGVPIAALVLVLMAFALWRALAHAIGDGRAETGPYPVQRAAFVVVFLVTVHSMLEYPLWYAYFLLPTAFAFGLCLERPVAHDSAGGDDEYGNVTRPYVLAAMFLVLGGTLALYDYMRVVVIFAPPAGAGPLEERILGGRKSVLFAHHADYAAATVVEHPGKVAAAFDRAPHYLLDARLMAAWAKALDELGESDKARHLAARLKEFRSDAEDEFLAVCRTTPLKLTAPRRAEGTTSPAAWPADRAASTAPRRAEGSPSTAESASTLEAAPGGSASAIPFQCLAPAREYRFEDFRRR
jgi:O-antigen ligase